MVTGQGVKHYGPIYPGTKSDNITRPLSTHLTRCATYPCIHTFGHLFDLVGWLASNHCRHHARARPRCPTVPTSPSCQANPLTSGSTRRVSCGQRGWHCRAERNVKSWMVMKGISMPKVEPRSRKDLAGSIVRWNWTYQNLVLLYGTICQTNLKVSLGLQCLLSHPTRSLFSALLRVFRGNTD